MIRRMARSMVAAGAVIAPSDNTQLIHEYACHEGNYGMANLLSAGWLADEGRVAK